MKKFLFTLLLVPTFLSSQVYKAGDIFPLYYDIVPDSVLSYHYGPYQLPHNEGYYLDINQDSQNDFLLWSFNSQGTLGGSVAYMKISPLNKNSYVRFGRKDSVNCGTFAYAERVAAPLQFQDSINSKLAVWDSVGLHLTGYYSGLFCQYPSNIIDFISDNDLYVGLKYQNSTDTAYGWIRVNCQQDLTAKKRTCDIKDLSFHSTCNVVPSLNTTSSSSILCSGETATLSANGAGSYTWSTCANTTSIAVSPTSATTYTILATSPMGCPMSASITQNVDACIGIKEYGIDNISIYPNPSNNKLYFHNSNGSEIKCSLYNPEGKEFSLQKNDNNEFDVSSVPEGLYFLQAHTEEGILNKKIIIRR
jgi:hypothetical protein